MKFFKMNNWKRIAILVVTTVATILAITLGSIFYVAKPGNVKKSIEYGGGVKYVVEVKNDIHSNADPVQVANSIYERIDALGVGGANIYTGKTSGHPTVTVEYPGISTKADRDALEKTILQKPRLVLTDIFGNPLFDEHGNFNKILSLKPNRFVGTFNNRTSDPEQFYVKMNNPTKGVTNTLVPLADGGAKSITQNGSHKVQLTFKSNAAAHEWGLATQYVSSLPKGNNTIVAWLDPDKFISGLISAQKGTGKTLWTGNMFKDAHVDMAKSSKLWKFSNFDASQYIISSAAVTKPLYDKVSVLEGSFSAKEASDIARKLNFGASKYSLKLLSKSTVNATYGSDSFKKAMIAGIVVFAIIALFLIVNYGLLGALSTISISLYIFMTLLMFTVMRGEYSPETIAALIIGLGMSVDANIITFERLKTEVYMGSNLKKSHKRANRGSLSSIFDANITTLIVAFVLFYFGTKAIVGLSITLIISIFFTLLIMLGFTRILSTALINTGYFENKKYLLGIHPKLDQSVQKTLDKPDYVKTSKWFSITSLAIITVSIVIFAIMAGIAGSLSGGMHVSKDFSGGSDIIIQKGSDINHLSKITLNEFNILKSSLIKNTHISSSEILFKNGSLVIDSTSDYSSQINAWKQLFPNISNYHVTTNIVSNDMATKLVKDSMLAVLIAIGLIIIYTLIRFKWTYSIAAIIALIHDALIVTSMFVITRVEISPVFVAGLLSVIGYSINDTIVTFDRIRERMNNHVGELTPEKIKAIGNGAVKDTIKRSLLTSLTTITAILVLMSFGNATKLGFNLAMLVGLIAGTYSSIFIATYLWTKFEIIRQKGISRREKKGFWKTKGLEEQIFKGINDYKA